MYTLKIKEQICVALMLALILGKLLAVKNNDLFSPIWFGLYKFEDKHFLVDSTIEYHLNTKVLQVETILHIYFYFKK